MTPDELLDESVRLLKRAEDYIGNNDGQKFLALSKLADQYGQLHATVAQIELKYDIEGLTH